MTRRLDQFARAFGSYKLAEIEAGGFADPDEAAGRREQAALEALIAIRAPHVAGVLGKLERVAEHVRDHPETFDRLVGELGAIERGLAAPGVDLAHVGDGLMLLARRFEAEDLNGSFVGLLRSAALDVRALAPPVA